MKDDIFAKYLNSLLMKKEISTYSIIGYFVGSLMHSLVQYGKKAIYNQIPSKQLEKITTWKLVETKTGMLKKGNSNRILRISSTN